MITADTITDEQIRELLADVQRRDDGTITRRETMRVCVAALHERDMRWQPNRARCAEILNARNAKAVR